MIRKVVTTLVENQKVQDVFSRVGLLLTALVFISSIILFPTFGEPNYISENAVTPIYNDFAFRAEITEKIIREIDNIESNDDNRVLSYLESYFDQNNMVHQRQLFSVYTGIISNNNTIVNMTGENLYGIYHTKRTYGSECNLISFNRDLIKKKSQGKSEIAIPLTLINTLSESSINWLSRDIIFLAYDGRYKSYGKAIKEFLNDYYQSNKDMLRCGIIRQAINLDITNDNFYNWFLLYQGLNGHVSDMDFYMIFQKSMYSVAYNHDENIQYEKKIQNFLYQTYGNHMIQYANKHLDLKLLQKPLIYALSSFKNMLYPLQIHYPHTHFLLYGIDSVTIKCTPSSNNKQNNAIDLINLGNIQKLGDILENALRTLMTIEERLHAGPTLWFLVGETDHIGVGRYLFPWMPLLIACEVWVVKNFVRIKKRLDFFGYFIDSLAPILLGWFLLYLPQMIEGVYTKLYGFDIKYGIEAKLIGNSGDIVDNMTLIYALISLILIIFGDLIFKFILTRLLTNSRLNNNRKIALNELKDPQIKYYIDNQWRIYLLFPFTVAAIGHILWLPLNLPFGIIGSIIFVPIILLLRPLSLRYIIQNMIVIGLLGVYGYTIYEFYIQNGLNWFKILKNLLILNSMFKVDLYIYLTTTFIPCLIYIKQMFFFRVKLI